VTTRSDVTEAKSLMDARAYGIERPRRQLLCDVQFTRLPSPSITAVEAGRGRGDEQSRLAKCCHMN